MKTSMYWLSGMVVVMLAVVAIYINALKNDELCCGIPTLDQQTSTTTSSVSTSEERFTGTIQAYDTACFADGVCSVTIDGKVVVLVIGFRDDRAVGALRGVDSIGDLESKLGAQAKVYAKKVDDTNYTLYGNSAYYVEVQAGPTATNTGKCYVGGCSGQICSDAPDAVSTCEYSERYACYKTTKCERQTTGKCGWTETTELKQCLAKF